MSNKREIPAQGITKESPVTDPLPFILAGKATFTLQNTETQNRFTFRIIEKETDKKKLHYVSVLTQGENSSPESYRYLGTIFDSSYYRHGKKSKIDPKASSSLAISWLIRHLTQNKPLPNNIKVCHCGHCGRCGRLLTVPESIETGLGPICRGASNHPTNTAAKQGKSFI